MATGAADARERVPHAIAIGNNVIRLACFAVDEYNKTHLPLEFKGVWRAEELRVEGKRYWLKLEAADDGRSDDYEARVFVTPTGVKALEEFKPVCNA